ncbi:MAG: GNAT family N-acetyltransferase [Acidobacteriota bacterium]
MQIQRQEHGRRGAFFIEEDGEWIAELTYIRSTEGQITIDHAEIDEELRGEDLGKDLVKAAVDFARESGLKIKPACPFAKKVFDETPDYQDVLAA